MAPIAFVESSTRDRERSASAVIDTPIGRLELEATREALVRVSFRAKQQPGHPTRPGAPRAAPEALDRLDDAVAQIGQYFEGSRTSFDIAVDLGELTDFRRSVLVGTAAIPYGSRLSYGELAAAAGRPAAARAVGSTQATNPLAIVIPCHRVVRSGGGLGEYGGGAEAKRWLLAHERSG